MKQTYYKQISGYKIKKKKIQRHLISWDMNNLDSNTQLKNTNRQLFIHIKEVENLKVKRK